MLIKYCNNCEREMGHKRSLGFGTLLMVLLTAGFWILLIPTYPKRCIRCGMTNSGLRRFLGTP